MACSPKASTKLSSVPIGDDEKMATKVLDGPEKGRECVLLILRLLVRLEQLGEEAGFD